MPGRQPPSEQRIDDLPGCVRRAGRPLDMVQLFQLFGGRLDAADGFETVFAHIPHGQDRFGRIPGNSPEQGDLLGRQPLEKGLENRPFTLNQFHEGRVDIFAGNGPAGDFVTEEAQLLHIVRMIFNTGGDQAGHLLRAVLAARVKAFRDKIRQFVMGQFAQFEIEGALKKGAPALVEHLEQYPSAAADKKVAGLLALDVGPQCPGCGFR